MKQKVKNIKVSSDKIFGMDAGLIRLFIAPLVLVLAIIVSVGAVIKPRLEAANKVKMDIKQVEKKKKETDEKVTYLSSIDQGKLREDASYLGEAVLKEKNAYVLVSVVRGMAARYGYLVEGFMINPGEVDESAMGLTPVMPEETPKTQKSALATERIPILLSLVGPKEEYLTLINSLEKSLPILSADNFVTKEAGEAAELELRLSAFYIPDSREKDLLSLSLADLTLTKEEREVLGEISGYTEAGAGAIGGVQQELKIYSRPDPFTR